MSQRDRGTMINSALRSYGLLLMFIGVLAISAGILGGVFVAGLIAAEGSLTTAHPFLFRDGLCLLILGTMALRNGGRIGRYSRAALVRWEWSCWFVCYLALLTTLGAVIFIEVGAEYMVPPIFYFLNAVAATRTRRRNEGYFDYLRKQAESDDE